MLRTIRLFVVMILAALLVIGTVLPAQAQAGCIQHVVQPGQNLFRIGLFYGVDYRAIAAANGIPDPRRIYVGQVLIICPGAPVAPPPAPPGMLPLPPGGIPGLPIPGLIPTFPIFPPAAPAAANGVSSLCAEYPEHGIPDRGSCEMQYQAGAVKVKDGPCKPHTLEEDPLNPGKYIQCSFDGKYWVTTGYMQPATINGVVIAFSRGPVACDITVTYEAETLASSYSSQSAFQSLVSKLKSEGCSSIVVYWKGSVVAILT